MRKILTSLKKRTRSNTNRSSVSSSSKKSDRNLSILNNDGDGEDIIASSTASNSTDSTNIITTQESIASTGTKRGLIRKKQLPQPSLLSIPSRRSSSTSTSTTSSTSTLSSTSSSSTAISKQVTFSNITIREYPITLGDNPACHGGAPISIGWNYAESLNASIDDYEYIRSNRIPRRPSESLVLSLQNRQEILLLSHIPFTRIVKASFEVRRISDSREKCVRQFYRQQRAKDILGMVFIFPRLLKKNVFTWYGDKTDDDDDDDDLMDIDRINADFYSRFHEKSEIITEDEDSSVSDDASFSNETAITADGFVYQTFLQRKYNVGVV